jgi:hypothetical protein
MQVLQQDISLAYCDDCRGQVRLAFAMTAKVDYVLGFVDRHFAKLEDSTLHTLRTCET